MCTNRYLLSCKLPFRYILTHDCVCVVFEEMEMIQHLFNAYFVPLILSSLAREVLVRCWLYAVRQNKIQKIVAAS